MAELAVQLLGPMRVRRRSGEDIAIGSKAGRALVIYLALHPGERRAREQLAALLWPDRGVEQSRHSLRQTLFTYRQSFNEQGAQLLQVADEEVWLDPSVDVDVRSFAEFTRESTAQSMNAAAALYNGELAAGFYFRSDPFERWLAAERTRLRNAACQVMTRLVAQFSSLGDLDEAIRINRKLIEADPVREESHRSLMRLLAAAGRPDAALLQYRECTSILRRMLDTEPDPDTSTLLREIRSKGVVPAGESGRPPPSPSNAAAERPAAEGPRVQISRESRPPTSMPTGSPRSSDQASGAASQAPSRRRMLSFARGWRPKAAMAVAALGILALAAFPTVRSWISGTGAPQVRLSVVVLPFANLTGDPALEYIVDALTEDVTSDLSRLGNSFVISTGTAFAYKGKAIDVRAIGRELGVRYVVQGALQSASIERKINVQMTDTETATIVWSDKFVFRQPEFDRYQELITARIAQSLVLRYVEVESERGQRKRPHHPDSIDLTMRGRAILIKSVTPDTVARAIPFFEAALKADEDNVDALAHLARSLLWQEMFNRDRTGTRLKRAESLIERIAVLNPNHYYGHVVRGRLLLHQNRFPEALLAFETANGINRNDMDAHAWRAYTLMSLGRAREAIPALETVGRLSPRSRENTRYWFLLGRAHAILGEYDTAAEILRRATAVRAGRENAWMWLTAVLSFSGKKDEARDALAEFVKLRPPVTVSTLRAEMFDQEPTYHRVLDELKRLGLPE